jgi:acetyl esterase/lipase
MQERKVVYGDHSKQYLKVFEPADREVDRELVIYFIHGGGWRTGKPERRRAVAEIFTQRGHTVVMPTYRVLPRYKFGHLRTDTHLAMEACLQLPQVKDKRFLLIGESAGGNLGALLLYDQERLSQLGLSQDRFAGFISLVGVLDMEAMPDHAAMRRYCGPRDSKLFHKTNPVSYLQGNEKVPVLIVHGTHDGLVPLRSATRFADRLNEIRSGMAELFIIEGGTHISVAGDWCLKPQGNLTTQKILSWIAEREA